MNQNPNTNGRASTPSDTKAVVDDAKKVATQVVDEAKTIASHATDKAREAASTRLSDGKDRAAEKVSGVAKALRSTAESLDDGPLPDLAERAADGIESVASYFKSRTVGEIVDEVNRFARREPAIFIGASFALGLIGGRFLKSSARPARIEDDYERFEDERFEDEPIRTADMRLARATPTPLAPVTTTPMQSIGGPPNKTPNGGTRGGYG